MSELKVNSVVDAAGGNTASINGYTPTMSNMAGRNRIINGDMRIDQRNNGASVTSAGPTYTVDRWTWYFTSGSGHSIQQVSDAPTGFTNSLKVTVGTGASPSAAQQNIVWQPIEGYNVSDLGFGATGSSTVTVSFWIKSSLTGTFNVWLQNSNSTRAYVSTYTVSSINTWEQKTVTVVGDTSGTWLKTNGAGLLLGFSLGCGSNFNATANTWSASDYKSTSGATNVIATSGATFYITGVQLEAGTVATPFERRPYGTELQLCQRYYQEIGDNMRISAMAFSSTVCPATWVFKTTMRAAPTTTATVGTSTILVGGSNLSVTGIGGGVSSTYGYSMDVSVSSGATSGFGAELRLVGGKVTASAEL